MPSKHAYPYYVKLDENVLFNNCDLDRLVEKQGWAGFGIYVGILTLFRNYEKTKFMIPVEDLQIIAKKTFNLPPKKFQSVVETLVEIGWLKNDKEGYIYSQRRKDELFAQSTIRQKQSEGGKKGMQSRYTYKSVTEEDIS